MLKTPFSLYSIPMKLPSGAGKEPYPLTWAWVDPGKVMEILWKGKRVVHLYMYHSEGAWSKPGEVSGWDPDEVRDIAEPSLRGPIIITVGSDFRMKIQDGKLLVGHHMLFRGTIKFGKFVGCD